MASSSSAVCSCSSAPSDCISSASWLLDSLLSTKAESSAFVPAEVLAGVVSASSLSVNSPLDSSSPRKLLYCLKEAALVDWHSALGFGCQQVLYLQTHLLIYIVVVTCAALL